MYRVVKQLNKTTSFVSKRAFVSTSSLLHGLTPSTPLEAHDGNTLIVGNQEAGVRPSAPFVAEQAEFIGKLVPNQTVRTDAGDVLALTDIVSARAGSGFVIGDAAPSFSDINKRPDDAVSLVTVAFNSFAFTKPIFDGDLIHFKASVICCTNSTVGMYVGVGRQAYNMPVTEHIGDCFVTFVAIKGKNLTKKSSGNVPAVLLTTREEIELYHQYCEIRKQSVKMNPAITSTLTKENVELDFNKSKKTLVRIASTTTIANRTFFPQDMNMNRVIFGGELLRFMEKAALHCGRVFAESPHVYTLTMLSMTFDEAVQREDRPICTCQVVCVRNSTMLITVRIIAGHGKTLRGTNTASFILIHTCPDGKTFSTIDKGIDLSNATQEELGAYWMGRSQMEHSISNRNFGIRTPCDKK